MKDHVVLRGFFDEEFVLTSWMNASNFQRACALEHHEAIHTFEHLTAMNRDSLELHRSSLLALARGTSPPLGSHAHDSELRLMVVDHLARPGGLILVDEGLNLPPCGVGQTPDANDETPSSSGTSSWSGDSSKWPENKKLLSMHPQLRPLVKGVIEGMTKRGFQPKIFFGWRSVAVQLEIFKKKHTKVKFSFHNVQKPDGAPDAYAADIVDRRWAWSPTAAQNGYWNALGAEAKEQGLYWGGDWKKPDWAHVQLVPNSQLKRLKKESGL